MRKLLFMLLCQFIWLPTAYAQDKQWAIQLAYFSELSQAKDFMHALHDKGLEAEVYLKDSGRYQVVMSGFKRYQDVLEKRHQLLDSHLIAVKDISITTSPYDKMKAETAAISQPEEASEKLIVQVLLNGTDIGTHFIDVSKSDIFIDRKLLKSIAIDAIPQALYGSKRISLNHLQQWMDYSLDSQSGDLLLTVKANFLTMQEQSLAVKRKSNATWIESDAMFLNYTLDYTADKHNPDVFRLPLELGLSIDGMSLLSQFIYDKKMQRTKTQWIYDNQDNLQRWSAGDIQGSSGLGSASLAGLRVFKNFGINPQLITTPGLETSILLDNASEVEVLVDGRSVYKGNFPAGPLNLKDIPFYRSGSVHAELIVRDVFGRKQVYGQLLYGSTGMLAQGFSEYDVSFGVESKIAGGVEPQYGSKSIFYGTYRYGLTSWLTPSLGMESDGHDGRVSLGSSLLLGEYGQLDSTFALSRRAQRDGYFLKMNYNYIGTSVFSPSIFFNTRSLAYGGVLDADTLISAKQREFGSALSMNFNSLGGITGRWSQQQDFARNTTQTGELLFNTVLPKNISLTTHFTRTWANNTKPVDNTSAALGYSFSNGLYLSANYSSSNQVDSFGLQLQWSPPLGEGFGFNESVNQQASGNPTSNTRVEYRNQYADVAINGSTGQQQAGRYNMQLNSALVWTEGDVYMSRPVRDAFALVRVNGIKDGMKVNLRGQYVGTTNAHGELLVPYAYSYIDNQLSIDAEAVSLGYSIPKTSQNVTMAYRGGGLVEFDVIQQHTIEGTLFYKKGDTLQSAQYSTLEYVQDGNKQSTVIGDDGALYLENLQAGDYAMTVFDNINTCHFDLHVEDSEKMVDDIGRVICVIGEVSK